MVVWITQHKEAKRETSDIIERSKGDAGQTQKELRERNFKKE